MRGEFKKPVYDSKFRNRAEEMSFTNFFGRRFGGHWVVTLWVTFAPLRALTGLANRQVIPCAVWTCSRYSFGQRWWRPRRWGLSAHSSSGARCGGPPAGWHSPARPGPCWANRLAEAMAGGGPKCVTGAAVFLPVGLGFTGVALCLGGGMTLWRVVEQWKRP